MNDMNGYDIEDLHLGMRATFSKTITEADIVLFAGVSGDNNGLHASVIVHSIDLARRRVTLDTTCRVGDLVLIEGQAVVMTTSSAKRRPAAAMPVAEVCL